MSQMRSLRYALLCLMVIFSMLLVSCGEETAEEPGDQPTEEQSGGEQPSGGEEPTAAPDLSGTSAANTGFTPAENGFAFPNYGDTGATTDGDTFPVVGLTPVELVRM